MTHDRKSEPVINGLVLVGGKSSRMGYDKSLIEYHGKPQREYLFDELEKLCKKVFVSCRASHHVPDHLNPLIDQFEIESPLNGILSAMTFEPAAAWFVVAADMPMIDGRALEYLFDRRDREKVATCFLDSENINPEPLFSIWEPKAFPLVKDFYSKGKISSRDFLKSADIKLIKAYSPDINTNINTPEELKSYNKLRGA